MGLQVDDDQQQTPLLESFNSADDSINRTGTIWTAMAHIITGVIGAGVLSLAWSVAQLGWIVGPLTMVVFAAICMFSVNLLSDCYKSFDPESGTTICRSYMEAVKLYLGERTQKIATVILLGGLYGSGITYTLTCATSARAIQQSNCYHTKGHNTSCEFSDTTYMMLFGAVQIVVSQIPGFHNMAWLSAVAAIMSFTYASIGLGLGLATVIENGEIKGNIGGVPAESVAEKLWLIFQALGDVAFAYPFTVVLLEIQDTLKSSPPQNRTMKKASAYSILITTFFFLCCGCFGYAAFGNATPGNLLTGFGFYEPYWLINFANACVIVHLVGGYQVYSQPLFAFLEGWLIGEFPEKGFVRNTYILKLPLLPDIQLSSLRLCLRTAFVVSTTLIAAMFPYFNQVLGVLGALSFWPLVIYFPLEMYNVRKKIDAWTRKWIIFQTLSMACLFVSVLAFIGSVQGLLSAKLS